LTFEAAFDIGGLQIMNKDADKNMSLRKLFK